MLLHYSIMTTKIKTTKGISSRITFSTLSLFSLLFQTAVLIVVHVCFIYTHPKTAPLDVELSRYSFPTGSATPPTTGVNVNSSSYSLALPIILMGTVTNMKKPEFLDLYVLRLTQLLPKARVFVVGEIDMIVVWPRIQTSTFVLSRIFGQALAFPSGESSIYYRSKGGTSSINLSHNPPSSSSPLLLSFMTVNCLTPQYSPLIATRS